jgi:hypothetical protein
VHTHFARGNSAKRFRKRFFNLLRVALIMNGLVAAPGHHRPRGTLQACSSESLWRLRMRGFRQEDWKAFARSFGPLVSVWFDSGPHQEAVLRLFGWKCCFLWALAGVVGFAVPGKWHLPACAASDLSLQTPFDRPVLLSPLLRTARFCAEGPFAHASAHKDKELPSD